MSQKGCLCKEGGTTGPLGMYGKVANLWEKEGSRDLSFSHERERSHPLVFEDFGTQTDVRG